MAKKERGPIHLTPEEMEFHLEKFKVEMRHRRIWREQAQREAQAEAKKQQKEKPKE